MLLRHILPVAAAPVIVQATWRSLGDDRRIDPVLLPAGTPPTIPSWATCWPRPAFHAARALMIAFPGVALALLVLTVNVLGDALRDAIDFASPASSGSKAAHRKEEPQDNSEGGKNEKPDETHGAGRRPCLSPAALAAAQTKLEGAPLRRSQARSIPMIDVGLHGPQPRLYGLRHAVRAGRQRARSRSRRWWRRFTASAATA